MQFFFRWQMEGAGEDEWMGIWVATLGENAMGRGDCWGIVLTLNQRRSSVVGDVFTWQARGGVGWGRFLNRGRSPTSPNLCCCCVSCPCASGALLWRMPFIWRKAPVDITWPACGVLLVGEDSQTEEDPQPPASPNSCCCCVSRSYASRMEKGLGVVLEQCVLRWGDRRPKTIVEGSGKV